MSAPMNNLEVIQVVGNISVQNNPRNRDWKFTNNEISGLTDRIKEHQKFPNSVITVSPWLGVGRLFNLNETFIWLRTRLRAENKKLTYQFSLRKIFFRRGCRTKGTPKLDVLNLRFVAASTLCQPTTENPFPIYVPDKKWPGLEGIHYVIENLPLVLNELQCDALAFPGLKMGGNTIPILYLRNDNEVFIESYQPGAEIGRKVWVCIFVEPGPITAYVKEIIS